MSFEDRVIYSEKSKATVRLATLASVIGGAMALTWYAAGIKSEIEQAVREMKVEIAVVKKGVERLESKSGDRYTATSAAKDWRSQEIVNSRQEAAVRRLEETDRDHDKRIRRMEVR